MPCVVDIIMFLLSYRRSLPEILSVLQGKSSSAPFHFREATRVTRLGRDVPGTRRDATQQLRVLNSLVTSVFIKHCTNRLRSFFDGFSRLTFLQV